MTFAQRQNRLRTHFSEHITVVKRCICVFYLNYSLFCLHQLLLICLLCHGPGGWSLASYCGGHCSIPGQCMWNLWWMKCPWDKFLSKYCHLSLSVIIPAILHTHSSSSVDGPFTAAVARHAVSPPPGHNTLRRHLHLLGLLDSPLCRKCGLGEETSAHILCECKALASLRHVYLGSFFLEPKDIRSLGLGAIWSYSKVAGLP